MMKMKKQSLYSSSDTNFKKFSRIFLHLDFSKTSNSTLNPFISKTSKSVLITVNLQFLTFLLDLCRFSELSRTYSLLSGLSSPEKFQNKISGLFPESQWTLKKVMRPLPCWGWSQELGILECRKASTFSLWLSWQTQNLLPAEW